VRFGARVAARLARDAARLGLGALDADACLAALAGLGAERFGPREGIVRLEASRSAEGGVRIAASARELGPEPGAWEAVVGSAAHGGAGPLAGAKLSGDPRIAGARAEADAAGAQEALLFDAEGRLVEGARTNLVVALAGGRIVTPPRARGCVAGVALEVVRERVAELGEADLSRADVARALEIVATNAVRGAVPIVRLDGRPVGAGAPGPLAARLREVLAAAEW
jgi:branched-subunit amino acid aminotransferase/4-amino-4-deoxychorismate lyase